MAIDLPPTLKQRLRPIASGVRRAARPFIHRRKRHDYARDSAAVLTDTQRQAWSEGGFLHLPGFFTVDRVQSVNSLIDRLWADQAGLGGDAVIDVFVGTPQERRSTLAVAPSAARLQPYKLNDLYLGHAAIREIALDERLAAILAELNAGAPIVCNTLNLEFGSQQADHTDSLYMAAPDGEHLIASWIALEDGHLDAGPLRYWPRSHRIEPYRNKHGGLQHRDDEVDAYRVYMAAEVARRGLKVERLVPRAGDLFIWHGQLFHGGEAIADPSRTRRSLVTHYWRARDVEGIHAEIGKGRYWHARKAHQVG